MIDFSDVPKAVLDEEIPLECGRCTFRFWRRIDEFAQLQRDTLFAECPRCQTVIDLNEAEFGEAIRQLTEILALGKTML
jgi:hypothetical protein